MKKILFTILILGTYIFFKQSNNIITSIEPIKITVVKPVKLKSKRINDKTYTKKISIINTKKTKQISIPFYNNKDYKIEVLHTNKSEKTLAVRIIKNSGINKNINSFNAIIDKKTNKILKTWNISKINNKTLPKRYEVTPFY